MGATPALAYVAVPRAAAGPAVLVIHSWWGLTRSFTQYADRLAEHGFLVGCADLFSGRTASTEADARALRAERRREPAHKLLGRCLTELLVHPARDAGPLEARETPGSAAVVGFSMGGHWALWLAQRPDLAISRTAVHYAARGGDYSQGGSPVLAHFAEKDSFVSAGSRRSMVAGLANARRRFIPHDYPGTGHWFAESDHPAYERAAADLALRRTAEFLADAA